MTFPKPKPGVGLTRICVDIDGTIAEPTWPSPVIGKPIRRAIDAMIEASRAGWEIVLYTARPASHVPAIMKWVDDNGLSAVVYDVITGKPAAAAFWDDRAVTFPEALGPEGPEPWEWSQRPEPAAVVFA